MTNNLWLNLPVQDLQASKDFFTSIGFRINPIMGNTPVSACLLVGSKDSVVMLFQQDMFKTLTGAELPDLSTTAQVLISIDATSKEEVDAYASKVTLAGGVVFSAPKDHGNNKYGCGFNDLDGHKWNVLYMPSVNK
jgi:uncharacterized protein